MGGEHSQATSFKREDWDLTERNNNYSVYRNRTDPSLHIEEHEKFTTDDAEYKFEKDIFQLRAYNPYLVAGAFFESGEERQFCSTSYKYRLFIEKIPIRLSDVQHIPFPDFIHLYWQALNGFALLSQRLGSYFQIQQPYVGINERGVVKVWLSKYFAHNRVLGGRITQEQMVKSVVDIVDRNVDPFHAGQSVPTVRNYLYRNADTLRFDQALAQLQGYVTAFNGGVVPQRLQCVEQVGGVYAIANRSTIYHQQDDLVDQNIFRPQGGEGSRVEIQSSRPEIQSNRPQLISQQNLGVYESPVQSRFQPEPLQFNPRSFSATPEFKLKESAVVVPREQVILNPTEVRENMSVVRRRRSEYQEQNGTFGYNGQGNSMRYSQVVPVLSQPQPVQIQSRPITFNRNANGTVPVGVHGYPVVANVSQPTSSFLSSSQVVRSPVQGFTSPRKMGGESSNQITFKLINPNGSVSKPISFAGNPSIANFSPGPSQLNTQRMNVATTSNEISEKSKFESRAEVGSVPAIAMRVGPAQSNRVVNVVGSSSPSIEGRGNQVAERIVSYPQGVPNGIAQINGAVPRVQERREVVYAQRAINVQHQPIEPSIAQKRAVSNKIESEVDMRVNPTRFEATVQKAQYASFSKGDANQFQSKLNGFGSGNKFAESNVEQYVPQKTSFDKPIVLDKLSSLDKPSVFDKPKSSMISADDGKSSQEFMRKLLEINRGGAYEQKSSSFKAETAYVPKYEQQTNYQRETNSIPGSDYNRYSQYNSELPGSNVHANEEFGRNAVSNIIDTQEGSSYIKNNPYSFGSNQPLKFQQNLTLKYSRLAEDAEPYSSKNAFGKYDFAMDPELMADLNRIPK